MGGGWWEVFYPGDRRRKNGRRCAPTAGRVTDTHRFSLRSHTQTNHLKLRLCLVPSCLTFACQPWFARRRIAKESWASGGRHPSSFASLILPKQHSKPTASTHSFPPHTLTTPTTHTTTHTALKRWAGSAPPPRRSRAARPLLVAVCDPSWPGVASRRPSS